MSYNGTRGEAADGICPQGFDKTHGPPVTACNNCFVIYLGYIIIIILLNYVVIFKYDRVCIADEQLFK